jgi:tetratricopeptide (TPR) repeat protein
VSAWDDANEMLARAESAATQGDRELAYQMFARASELDPQVAKAWQGRAAMAVSTDEALVSLAYASALEPKDTGLAGNLDSALRARVDSANNADVPLLVALGREFAQVGLTERAQTLFVRAVELNPASTDALIWAAGTSASAKEQMAYLDRALETNPTDPRVRAAAAALKPGGGLTPIEHTPADSGRDASNLNSRLTRLVYALVALGLILGLAGVLLVFRQYLAQP